MRIRLRLTGLLLLSLNCAAFGAGPEIMVNIEKRGDAFIVDSSFEVAVPLRTAWEVLTDFENMEKILSNLSKSTIISRSGNTMVVQQDGTARYGIFSYSFVSEREMKLEPMKRIHAHQLSGTAKRFDSLMELTPAGKSTAFTYHAEIFPDSGIARSFGAPFIQDEVEEQFKAMSAEMLKRNKP